MAQQKFTFGVGKTRSHGSGDRGGDLRHKIRQSLKSIVSELIPLNLL